MSYFKVKYLAKILGELVIMYSSCLFLLILPLPLHFYKMGKTRLSNFELLRILCMWGVLANHVLQTLYDLHSPTFSFVNEARMLLMNISIIAVNCFVLISGYFRIKVKIKSFTDLYFQCLFYAIILSIISFLITGEGGIDGLKRIVFPFSEGGMWFLTAYLALYLISPLLNAGYNGLSSRGRIYTLISLLLVDIYFGYMHQSAEITSNGYHLVHFITLYFIGSLIADYKDCIPIRHIGVWGVLIIILMNLLHLIKIKFFPIALIYSLKYNSPFVMIASVIFFIWTSKWNFHSKWINYVSVSVLSVYIIHVHPFVWKCLFDALKFIQKNYDSENAVVLMSIILIVFYFLCIFMDKLRLVICTPLVKWTTNKLENYTSRF